jgi:predicted permease
MRDAYRALRQTPVVSAVAILSLALGIGANTAIFSIVNALMLRALPVKEPQRLVQVLAGSNRTSWSNPLWEELRARDRDLFAGAFAYSAPRFNLSWGGETRFVNGMFASGEIFEVLGVPAMLGRTFTRADDVRNGGKDGPVAVISYGFWLRHFGGAADAIGRTLTLDRVAFTIIGVTTPSFTGIDHGSSYDVAIPLGTEPLIRGEHDSAMNERSWWWLRVMARLKEGDTREHATAALRGVQPQMRAATIPPNWRAKDLPSYLKEPFTLRDAATGPNSLGRAYRQPLYILTAVVALVLLIACANIANLLLARANARRHELSVRVALGATRWRIARQLLLESLLLSLSGAALGLLFARWGSRLLIAQLSSEDNAIALDVGLDWVVLSFTVAVAAGTALLFGIVPALRGTRAQPQDALRQAGRSIVGDSRLGFGSALVVVQVALSLVLVTGAALFMRTFASLSSVRLGFEPDPILLVETSARRSSVTPEQRAALFERMRQAVLAVPGVRSAGLSQVTPLTGSSWDLLIQNPPGLSLAEHDRDVYVNAVSPGWFATYGTPILSGRDFTERDDEAAPPVVLVNETFVKKYFGGAHALGRSVRLEPMPDQVRPEMQIVGVVRDAVYDSLRDRIPPTIYLSNLQPLRPPASATLSVRAASGSASLLARSVVDAMTHVDPDVSLTVRPYKSTVRAATVKERVLAMLSGFFGALALLLAGLGLYGVMSYAVSRRRTEIGIRMALGAGPAGAVRLVLGRAALLVGAGVIAGTAVTLWSAQFVASLLFGLRPRDPATVAGAAAVLAAIGLLAGWLPARRASRIDPAEVLREA